ncbi:hypothetical protein AWR36_006985 [Microbulbifer flavimaris]|uniref:Uncharacterized protein n=1 Tax=Microbulbifer flavimaris TaxID=1781068 RepID=A0ABX4I008_9GAMM|nr:MULTISPECIES: DUF748 domain-containing protein [Microbulbifer]KUJ83594.1 hypothetical protein AVO43_06970 [Microbulbifer sp. ZGT114]PCO05750.1 hypothetical protein AWR36_006985 [Microbulbifer flavimaris]
MPKLSDGSSASSNRLMWWLLGIVLSVGALSLVLSAWLHVRLERELQQRGLEAEIGRLWFSIPRLALELRNVRVQNSEGRGLDAEELVLDYGWLDLLRGRLRLQQAELVGVDMDLASTITDAGRRWEVAGWALGAGGERRDRDLWLGIGRLHIRDSRLCYLARPAWQKPSCLRFAELHTRDWFLSLERTGNEPLQLQVGAGQLDIRNLLVRPEGGERDHTVIVKLALEEGLFARPGNRITTDELVVRRFGSCLPARWGEAIPALGRVVGHCATARRLNLAGDVVAAFGAEAEVGWQRGQGQAVQLRYANRRWQNWRAETIALKEAHFSRREKSLRWAEAGASGFDWCPPGLRDTEHHLCLRAGSVGLPDPVTFEWTDGMAVEVGSGRLQQTQLLDLAGQIRNPLTLHDIRLAALGYRDRRLTVSRLQMESGSGCVPGALWQVPDHCVRLAGLRGEEELQVQFADSRQSLPWGVASGPLTVGQFHLAREGQEPLQLRQLRWQQLRALGGSGSMAEPLLVRDPELLSLQGCVPDTLLPDRLRPLCTELQSLTGQGTFAWAGGEDGYLIFGDLQLQRLLLGDRRGGSDGLLLQQLAVGNGFLRPKVGGGISWASADASATDPGSNDLIASGNNSEEFLDDEGLEKGRLLEGNGREVRKDGESRGEQQQKNRDVVATGTAALPDLTDPNLHLSSAALQQLDGCLPDSWAQLLFRQPESLPTCFDLRGLAIDEPLRLAWQGGLGLRARALALERAEAATADGESLLLVEQLSLPDGQMRVGSGGRRLQLSLPDFALQTLDGCLPGGSLVSPMSVRCIDVVALQLGAEARFTLSERRLAANLDGTDLQRLQLTGLGDRLALDLRGFSSDRLQVDWPGPPAAADVLELGGLELAQLSACLPPEASIKAGGVAIPRCLDLRDLNSAAGANNLAAGPIRFLPAPGTDPLWQIDDLALDALAFTSDTVQLGTLRLEGIEACGLAEVLPGKSGGGCLTWRWLQLAAGSRVTFGEGDPEVQLAALDSAPLSLGGAENPVLSFDSLGWQQLRWDGGTTVGVTDFALRGIRACRPGSGGGKNCLFLRELALPGAEVLSFSRPFSVSGAIRLSGLGFGTDSTGAAAASVSLREPVYRQPGTQTGMERAVGELAEISGCLPAAWLAGNRLSPCYEFGRVELQGIERRQTESGTVTELVGLSIDGVRLRQQGFPDGLPAELLQLKQASVERLAFGAGRVAFSGFSVEGAAGCLPAGYVQRLDHCLMLESVDASGTVDTGRNQLELSRLQLSDLQLLSGDGKRLLRADSALLHQFTAEGGRFALTELFMQDFGLLGRAENAPEYKLHAWQVQSGDAVLQDVFFDLAQQQLEVPRAFFTKPRIILARDDQGNISMEQGLADLIGEPVAEAAEEAGRAASERTPFRYRLGEMYVDRGRFTWLDRQGLMRAKLPIRHVNVLLRGASNYPEDPPAEILLGARPGGFGEMHLAGELDYLDIEKWDATLLGYVANANLIPAQPYIANLLGYKILQGQLDARVNIEVRANDVDALAHMRLNKIRLRRVRESDQLPVEQPMIPLDIALLVMEDAKRNVNFKMPVSGDLYDPEFSFSYIFSDLLQQAILEALFSYFSPVGFYTLASRAWTRFRTLVFLDTVEFSPGSVELSAIARQHLDEVVETLEEKPEARPGICGIANARDWMTLYPDSTPGMNGSRRVRENFYREPPVEIHDELQKLAQRRSRQVERYLLDRGVSADEFIQCAPDYDGSDFELPRVEFSR